MSGVLPSIPIDSSSWSPQKVAIVGAGLLGGSFGLAIRKLFPSASVIGVSRSDASRDAATRSGAVTRATSDVEEACSESDLVVVSVPVDGIASMVIRASRVCRPDGLVIDLGSTKAGIVQAVEKDERASQLFVGTHPIAGGEKTGAEHARYDLFHQKTVIVTPGLHTSSVQLGRTIDLWQRFHAKVVCMSPSEHDVALASVSHLPHIMASMVAGILKPNARELVGSGWIDTTRVASGDASLWTAICRENAPAILEEIKAAGEWMKRFSASLETNDFETVRMMLSEAKILRDTVLTERKK